MSTPLPKISRPMIAALAEAGATTLEQAAKWTERDLLALHGGGAKGIVILKAALAEKGLALRDS